MGDLKFGRTVHSLTKLLRMYDCSLQFVAPNQLAMPDEYIWPADKIYQDLNEALDNSDVLYVTRVQKERMQAPKILTFLMLSQLII